MNWRCWFGLRHDWKWFQHNVRADEALGMNMPEPVFVICFKVYKRCATSKLVHLLE